MKNISYGDVMERDKYGRVLAWIFVDDKLLQEDLVMGLYFFTQEKLLFRKGKMCYNALGDTMDRNHIEKIARNPEDRMLLAKLWDKINAGIRIRSCVEILL